ncbi:PaaI family thioesterase [Pontibacter pamirensis]|uniref:PaaI family thioesterase n=1 Tax=Pontibacter pamirensis TaxID=2562824 RepID=UPI001F47F3C0|nr:PaaI family thioesterase [Pontibacter pamirensis]
MLSWGKCQTWRCLLRAARRWSLFCRGVCCSRCFYVTSSFQLNLLRPVNGGTLKAVGTLRSISKNLFVAEATLYNERGKEVASGTGQFMRTTQPLGSLEGYTY